MLFRVFSRLLFYFSCVFRLSVEFGSHQSGYVLQIHISGSLLADPLVTISLLLLAFDPYGILSRLSDFFAFLAFVKLQRRVHNGFYPFGTSPPTLVVFFDLPIQQSVVVLSGLVPNVLKKLPHCLVKIVNCVLRLEDFVLLRFVFNKHLYKSSVINYINFGLEKVVLLQLVFIEQIYVFSVESHSVIIKKYVCQVFADQSFGSAQLYDGIQYLFVKVDNATVVDKIELILYFLDTVNLFVIVFLISS